jgi:hypothetical protein
VDKVNQLDVNTDKGTFPMVVTTQEIIDVKAGPRPRTIVSRVEAGSFELIICSACGYTEWYAYDLEGLAKIPGVRLVGPNTENGGPYR